MKLSDRNTALFGLGCLIGFTVLIVPHNAAQAALIDPPLSFSAPLDITNPFHPFVENRIKLFAVQQGHTDAQVIDVYDTARRTFSLPDGTMVECATLIEMEIEDGAWTEISRNYFAQADDGTVFYFGETVDIYEEGAIVGHEGSWLVGGATLPTDPEETAAAAEPAVFMPGQPHLGDMFKPEDLFPLVDESDEVVKTGKTLVTPAGQFTDTIKIQESSLLTDETEIKWYAPGVGVIQTAEKGENLELLALMDTGDDASREALIAALLDELLHPEERD